MASVNEVMCTENVIKRDGRDENVGGSLFLRLISRAVRDGNVNNDTPPRHLSKRLFPLNHYVYGFLFVCEAEGVGELSGKEKDRGSGRGKQTNPFVSLRRFRVFIFWKFSFVKYSTT